MVTSREPQRPAVFLDRDGVLVVPHFRDGRSFAPRRLQDFSLYEDIRHPLTHLKIGGFLLVVITNQPDVGKGLIDPMTVDEMHQILMRELPLDLIKTCPHPREDRCACRKPKPGLILEAARQLDIRLDASFMVGDRASDIEAGQAAGCRTVFIDLGYTAEPKPTTATYTARSMAEAAQFILRTGSPSGEGEEWHDARGGTQDQDLRRWRRHQGHARDCQEPADQGLHNKPDADAQGRRH
jgi:D-glycero-D-manno-heptose 1,7-bisphosphate phosphatase